MYAIIVIITLLVVVVLYMYKPIPSLYIRSIGSLSFLLLLLITNFQFIQIQNDFFDDWDQQHMFDPSLMVFDKCLNLKKMYKSIIQIVK